MPQSISSARQLGVEIRARRKQTQLTATEAAALARVSRRLLIELERGKRPNVSLSAVLRILAILGLDMEVKARGLPGTRPSSRLRI
jgi:transcriptional regulator with XRE-family HTH domain